MQTFFIILLEISLLALGIYVSYLHSRGKVMLLKKECEDAIAEINLVGQERDDLKKLLDVEMIRNKELIRQKSSQATKSGNYIETLSPLLEKFPADIYNPNVSLKWLGDPIDFISFNFEMPEIIFIEVKSGEANLSHRQKLIKKAVKEGLIRFVEFRMNSDGSIEVSE